MQGGQKIFNVAKKKKKKMAKKSLQNHYKSKVHARHTFLLSPCRVKKYFGAKIML